MGSRNTHEGADNVYAAAQLWVDRALRADDSLFTPGTPIWSRKWLRELRERFLDRPDVSGEGFLQRFEQQLVGSPPEIYQLAAEALFVHLLIVWPSTMGGDAKEAQINQVLRWSGESLTIPPSLVDSLKPGIASSQAFNTFRPYHIGFLSEFVEQWKEQEPSEQQDLLDDPWGFKAFVTRLRFQGTLLRRASNQHRVQREALYHLVFPDSFESIVGVERKESVAKTFAHLIAGPTDDVDRKLAQIRSSLEDSIRKDISFDDPDIRIQWDTDFRPWDEFIRRAKAIKGSGGLEEDIRPKVDASRKLQAARKAVLEGDPGWVALVRRGMVPKAYPILHQIPQSKFNNWISDPSDVSLRALQGIWALNAATAHSRIQAFAELFPRSVISGQGTRTTVASVLLMGIDAERYPPFRTGAFQRAYGRTGYDKQPVDRSEAEIYEHALGFLDRVIKEASDRGLALQNRLEAQSVIWLSQGDSQPPPDDPDGVEALAEELHLSAVFLENIETLIDEKKQVIFQGPPGTGKTYVAQKLANHLAGSKERVTLVQFHPSYAYEDFVQGFRPTTLENGQPGFELRDGPLRAAAKRARKEPDAKHFLIIDEINRGQIAKVFGELYFLLEYRDSEVSLQYSDEPFSLPKNLYIIGTMNTADRSIALVDLALRRRFYFVEFHPDDEPVKGVLRRWLKSKGLDDMGWVADVVELANEKMEDDRHAAIGPSYFMKPGLDNDAVERIWKHSVLPYIEERRYGDEDGAGEFALKALRREAMSTREREDSRTQGDEGDGEQRGDGTAL